MKNVQYIGQADRSTVGDHTWHGHGDIVALPDDEADRLATSEPKRFRLPGGAPVTPDDGTASTADQGSPTETPRATTKRKATAKASKKATAKEDDA